MADLDLRVDYQDDILDASVNTKRKYNIIENADGTKSLEDVSVYTQKGDTFGAVDINKINQAVLDLIQSLSNNVKIINGTMPSTKNASASWNTADENLDGYIGLAFQVCNTTEAIWYTVAGNIFGINAGFTYDNSPMLYVSASATDTFLGQPCRAIYLKLPNQ